MVSRLFKGRPPKPGDKVLDPGCGRGAFIEGIVRWCKSREIDLPRIVGVELDSGRAAHARAAFGSYQQIEIRHGDFLTEVAGSFDFIIGNPPYVSILALSQGEKRKFRAMYETARGRFDLYLLFFERALKSLKPGGRLVFITPEKFLYVATAAPLRRLLSKFQVEEIRLEDEEVFNGLVTYPTITTVANRRPSEATVIRLRDDAESRFTLSSDGKSWMPLIRGAEDHTQQHFVLRDICARVSCGVATGADSVFVRETKGLEPELVEFARPTIAGRELKVPGKLGGAKYSMLVPYTKTGSLIDEGKLGALGDYLRRPSVRERLLRRTCVRRKPWYSFHETPPLSEVLRPKILCKDITQRPQFWIERSGNLVPRHSVYYLVPDDPAIIDRLCAYLNSKEVAGWLSKHCQRAANGFLRLQSSALKAIPIPDDFRPTQPGKRESRSHVSYPELPGLAFSGAAR
jgi:adenine-specific DNA-methyltransferase